MNIAVIFAGGTGQRMNTKSKPKQFLEIHGKPVLVYTLEKFQDHPEIDGIVLACLEDWIPYSEDLIRRFGINKIKSIVPGGKTGQESIFNALKKVQDLFGDENESIVLIHDGVRPLIDSETISNCIKEVKKHGNAITVAPAIETIFVNETESNVVGKIIDRSNCQLAKAPQCFYFKEIYKAHLRANLEGKARFIDSADMMQYYGYKLFTVKGPAENIKITTPIDFYTFRAILDAQENYQIIGF